MLKKLFCLSSLAIAIIVLSFPIGITSCTKTNTKTIIDTVIKVQTDTVIKTDTLQEKDTLLTAAILTANPWKATYDRASIGGNIQYYNRGASGNTMALDNEYITFNLNNTGTYTDNSGTQTSFTWSFSDTTRTKLTWILNAPTPFTISWENLSYDDGAIHYTEYYTQGGVPTLSTEIRVPK